MKFVFVTLFPELIEQATAYSIMKRAADEGILSVCCINPRDFSVDKHRTVDDTPCGGGVGMVLKPEPFLQALAKARELAPQALTIALTPAGQKLVQTEVKRLAHCEHDIIFICGHYEGFDQRILDQVDEEFSIGDYVLTGGELPALVIMDAVARYVPGVLGKAASAEDESFSDGLLEYPQYTRPVNYQGACVPPVLLSGDHAKINAWRRKEALKQTYVRRPDLLAQANLSTADAKLFLLALQELKEQEDE